MILVDTSVIIDFLRQKDKTKTWLYTLAQSSQMLSVSIITHTELYASKSIWEKPKALPEMRTIFSGLNLIPLTEAMSVKAGKYATIQDLHLIDAIIAATATVGKHRLATLNQKHFQKIPHLKLLTPSH
ncbi:MAG: type II toxin-antitoxin system VapC family toxin [Candidatus Chisholmbacteria bacterium]|nr:type II toxin-antitoxin system VapC family toxin [Candidatus Chisholmbacteria bacterium]